MSLTSSGAISSPFIWRRIHSLMGLWLIVFLFEHLIVNSQAALWIGDDGNGFVKMVNLLESIPYLQVIETIFIGVPIAVHGIWGIKRALEPKLNSFGSGGKTPHMTYGRNRAFTWQRVTSWILLFGIIGHVVQMRFIEYPVKVQVGSEERYLNKITFDNGLYTLGARLNVRFYTPDEIKQMEGLLSAERAAPITTPAYSEKVAKEAATEQKYEQGKIWVKKLASFNLKENDLIVSAPSPGKAMLLMVRDQFKSPLMSILYTIFVLAAAFHAFNGFWTALITWGAILSYRSQRAMLPVGFAGMALLAFLGLAAIWGSYWINLRN